MYSQWIIRSNKLLRESLQIPVLKSPNDVLIKPIYVGLNRIDCKMLVGYGQRIPFTSQSVGRECTAVVLDSHYSKSLIDKKVVCMMPPFKTGLLAELAVIDKKYITLLPECFSDEQLKQASCIPYTAATIFKSLQRNSSSANRSLAIVIGAAGGVGHLAVQLLKPMNRVVAVTREHSKAFVEDVLQVECVTQLKDIDLGNDDVFVLDLVGVDLSDIKAKKRLTVATAVHSVISRLDSYLIPFILKDYLCQLRSLRKSNKASLEWLMVSHSKEGTQTMLDMLIKNKLRVYIDKQFKLNDAEKAIGYLEKRPISHGKIIVDCT